MSGTSEFIVTSTSATPGQGTNTKTVEPVEDKKSASATPVTETADETTEESETSETDSEEHDSEAEGDEPEGKEGEKPKKKGGGFQRKINKLTSRVSEKDREIEFLRSQLDKANGKAGTQEPEKTSQEPNQVNAGKPSKDDPKFESYDQYLEALAEWKLDQREKDREIKEQTKKAQQDFESRKASHFERVNALKEQHEDYADVMDDVKDIMLPFYVQDEILKSDNSAELLYELAKQPDELKRISQLSAAAAARAIGRFEAKLEKPESETTTIDPITKQTKTPSKPIQTVKAKGTPAKKSIFDKGLSFEEYESLRKEQLKGK